MTIKVKNKLNKTLSIRLSDIQFEEFFEYCYKSRISASELLRHVIEKLLDKNNSE